MVIIPDLAVTVFTAGVGKAIGVVLQQQVLVNMQD